MRGRAPRAIRQRIARTSLIVLGALVLTAAGATPALADAWWRVSSRTAPTFLTDGTKATIVVAATNLGDSGVNATTSPVSIKDILPPNLEATEISGEPAFHTEVSNHMKCELSTLTCTSQAETYPPFERLEVTIMVNVKPGATTGEENQVSVQGGEQEGAGGVVVPNARLSKRITVNGLPTPFGVEEGGYDLSPEEDGGAVDSQAGSHPFQLTTTLNLDQTVESVPEYGVVAAAPALPRNLSFELPPGLIGDPRAVPPCATADFLAFSKVATNACKPESAIGVVVVTLDEPAQFHNITRAVPLWNLEPAQGEPARFGFEVLKVPVVLDTSLRSGGDYGVTVSVHEAPEAAQLLASEVTIWGVPGEASHDQSRGWACLLGGAIFKGEVPCEPPAHRSTAAFLTLPGSCTGPLRTDVEGQSWPLKSLGSEPGEVFLLQGGSTEDELAGFEGCDALPFDPSIGLESTEHSASTPTGLSADVHVPQQTTLEAGRLGESGVRDTSVALPEGVQLNPSAAGGLEACSEQQIGFEGPPGEDPLSPGAPPPLRFSSEPAGCPDASKIGLVHIKTPLLEHELQGAVYLATPAPLGEAGKNPFDALLALYLLAEEPAAGIRVKLAGETQLNASTGQLTSTFLNAPQVPFEELRLELFGGPRASLSTPAFCGTYAADALFTPWSGTSPVQAFSEPNTFAITSGPEGSACPSTQQPLAPAFRAGSTNLQAGAFTNFTLQITRPDQDQALTGLTVHLPAGNAAILASVKPCPEPHASIGTCGPESEIGEATATSGLGPDPYTVTGGRAYITGPYQGAPFGLSIVTPAVAGPFDLGLVVVRSKIEVDPHTAQVSITSSLPTVLQGVGRPATGIPLQLHRVEVTVDRQNFEFNPTNCTPTSITGTVTGAQGATASVSSPFQVANCQSLPFKPTLTAQTQGRTSKADGASFDVKVTSSHGQANIAKTTLVLPKILPARLSTIQKACLAKTFEANPASCPEGSNIGSAIVHTPVLESSLSGPAYLVSHGNAAWPDVEFVLQGEGITLVLDGQTQIKGGVTTSSFNSVPDAPVSSFEAILPEGPHSALTTALPASAKYSLCGQKLIVPTTLTGQNGAVIKQSTKVSVTGCHGVKAATSKKLSRVQRLKRALVSCRKRFKHSRARRQSCERKARKAYRPKKHNHRRAAKGHGHDTHNLKSRA